MRYVMFYQPEMSIIPKDLAINKLTFFKIGIPATLKNVNYFINNALRKTRICMS